MHNKTTYEYSKADIRHYGNQIQPQSSHLFYKTTLPFDAVSNFHCPNVFLRIFNTASLTNYERVWTRLYFNVTMWPTCQKVAYPCLRTSRKITKRRESFPFFHRVSNCNFLWRIEEIRWFGALPERRSTCINCVAVLRWNGIFRARILLLQQAYLFFCTQGNRAKGS